MKKILTIVGARPQFIKIAAVSRYLRKFYREVLVDTGQHYDYKLAGVFFEELQIPAPDYHLEVGSGLHGYQTAKMMTQLEEIVLQEAPDAIMVYGDTNSTLAGALVASKLHIPLFHVEAGLRSYNKKMPEEVNRVLTDHVSDLLFAPTETAVQNLRREGIEQNVFVVGDVMYDAVLYYCDLAEERYYLQDFGVEKQKYYLATIHRAENTDDPDRLRAIFAALLEEATPIILPLHPRTRKHLEQIGLLEGVESASHLKVIEPVSYLEMLLLEKNALAVITDSGGVQKEAYFAKVPCFTLRDQTEWVETIQTGWNQLVNPLNQDLSAALRAHQPGDYVENVYGDGQAAIQITERIHDWFEKRAKHGGGLK